MNVHHDLPDQVKNVKKKTIRDNRMNIEQNSLQLASTRKGHGQSGWSPIGCEGFHTSLTIPSPLPTTLVFRKSCRLPKGLIKASEQRIVHDSEVNYISIRFSRVALMRSVSNHVEATSG